jgi:threonine 3-dehydrogenase
MKAIVKQTPNTGVVMKDVPKPSPAHGEVLIKVKKTSICGTDLHLYLWDEWARKTLPVPSIIGHEFVGIIEEVAQGVTAFKPGDRVSAEGHITCGSCRFCKTGQRVLCPKTIGIGVNRDGVFAEYCAVPEENLFLMPDFVSDDEASLFDPLGNAVHTALSYDLVGKHVLITGAGPIGLMSIPLVKQAGAKSVTISDLNPYRLEMAKKMGATHVVNVKETPLLSISGEHGFDVCLEMSGSPRAFADCVETSAHGGKIVLLGILPEQVPLDWHKVIFKMLTIKGIYGREIFNTWYQVCDLIEGGLDIIPVITHRLKADDFQKGFEAMLSGKSGKVILDWD